MQSLDLIANHDFNDYKNLYQYLIKIPDLNIKFLFNYRYIFLTNTSILENLESQKDLEMLIDIHQYTSLNISRSLDLLLTYKKYNIPFNKNILKNVLKEVEEILKDHPHPENANKINLLKILISNKASINDIIKIKNEYDFKDFFCFFKILSENLDVINFNKMYKRLKYYENNNLNLDFFYSFPNLFGINKKIIEENEEAYLNNVEDYIKVITVFRERADEWIKKFDGNIHDAAQILNIDRNLISDNFIKLREFLFEYFNKENHLYIQAIVSHWANLPQNLKDNRNFEEILQYIFKKQYKDNRKDGFTDILPVLKHRGFWG